MSDHRLTPTGERRRASISRRRFVERIARSTAGTAAGLAGLSSASLLAACGDEGAPTSGERGHVEGTVVDLSGEPAGVGRIYLMHPNGLQTGRYVDVRRDGRWRIPNVAPGEWQVRFWGPGVGHVPHDVSPNPVRIAVESEETTRVTFPVELGHSHEHMVEIYVGDTFFQEQPLGEPNAPVTVDVGTEVCWYNVSRVDHVLSGQPWGESPVLKPTDSFIWDADRTGEFDYQCPFHIPEQRSKLIVKEGG